MVETTQNGAERPIETEAGSSSDRPSTPQPRKIKEEKSEDLLN